MQKRRLVEIETDVDLVSPIQPHELDKRIRSGLDDIVRRVAAKSAVQARGQDLLLRVYLTGMYHGAALANTPAKEVDDASA